MKAFFGKYLYLIFIITGVLLCSDTTALLLLTASRSLGIFMPFCLGAPLILAGLCELLKPKFLKNVFGKILRWLCIGAYSLFICIFSFTTILAFFAGHATPAKNADVLIVLGCGVKGTRPTLTLSRRLDRALEYLNENPDTLVIVSGGQGPTEDISEADAMYNYLTERHLSPERIIKEDKSTSTEENFAYSKKIIDDLFPQGAKICYVTTYFHVYRAGLVAQKQGIDADGMGSPGVWYITFNDYLRECVGICVYALTGKV